MIDKLVGEQDVVIHAVGQKNSERHHKDQLPEMKLKGFLCAATSYEVNVFFSLPKRKRMW